MAGIYVHVPFCRCKCAYCDFYSLARPDKSGDYAAALRSEYAQRRHELADLPVETVYFGGGTPSMLPPDMLTALAAMTITADTVEATIEVNPEDVTAANARAWRRAGFNRVSMGVQSLDDDALHYLRRRHSAADALAALATLRRAGFDNISADLIYGLPAQSPAAFADSLRSLLDAGIEHLSAYILSYEPGTLMDLRRKRGECAEADDDTIAQMYADLCRTAADAAMEHYEISNFALPGRRSRHNSAYWTGTPYLGLGPGAHSLGADGRRRYQEPDLRAYIASPADTLTDDPETADEMLDDIIMVSLRRAEGLDLTILAPADAAALESRALPRLADGSLCRAGSRLFIPENKWLLADSVIRDLMT